MDHPPNTWDDKSPVKTKNEDISPIPLHQRCVNLYHSILAGVFVVLLMGQPLFLVLIPGWVFTSDISTVLLYRGCIGSSTLAIFVLCMLKVLLASWLLRKLVLPAVFGTNRWSSYNHLKRKKLVGYCVKIIVRWYCFILMAVIISPYQTMDKGLFGEFNKRVSLMKIKFNHTTISCGEAGMVLSDACALRAWIFIRIDFMVVMVWELAYIPELEIHNWIHHLFLIAGNCLSIEPQFIAIQKIGRAYIDGVIFYVNLYACVTGTEEFCGVMYHYHFRNPNQQLWWMRVNVGIQVLTMPATNLILPCVGLYIMHHQFGSLVWVYVAIGVCLFAIEARMMWVKIAILKHIKGKVKNTSLTKV